MAHIYTSTQAFWETPELVAMCFESVDKRSLSSCARISKRLSEIALDALYRDGPGYVKILKLLCSMNENESGSLHFSVDLTPDHWDRFRRYSSRIYSLTVHHARDPFRTVLNEALVELLTTLPQGEVLLPSLTRLNWEDGKAATNPFATLLFHDKLQEVNLTVAEWDTTILLQHLARRSPNIITLRLKTREIEESDEFNVEEVQEITAKVVPAFSSLRSLGLPPDLASMDVIRALSQHPNLVRLWVANFAIKGTQVDESDFKGGPSESFSNLRELSLGSTNLIGLSSTFLSGTMIGIVSLHVDIIEEDHIPEFLKLVSTSYPNLRDFGMMFVYWRLLGPQSWFEKPLTMGVLKPLLSMRRLESLVLEHPMPPDISDEELGEFSLCFPELKHLELCVQARGSFEGVVPTLSCLLLFAQNCRKLISIGIYMDATISPPIIKPDQKVFAPSLRDIHAFCSKIRQYHPVADFLAGILPPEAKLTLIRGPARLVPVMGKMTDYFGSVGLDDRLDETSRKCRNRWQEASRLLADLFRVRQLLASERKRNEEVWNSGGSML
ncbi:hypothetical protein SISSUDRAFT_1122801 [Sistotremastrum suecicum HHB10207 ss-3]|uniref:F-box domain-containing protein n=1 Tax=Sistotremastrum suecicum HHB10207 ss-3 TaxID=1314776 RepID=A0A165YTR5_9AGAM|nr:hypothetical protein SISSUDRAFT_1122801 [Sistotremastrum suecicum HHB10207 ss-3]